MRATKMLWIAGVLAVICLAMLNVSPAVADGACDKDCGTGEQIDEGTRDENCRWRECTGSKPSCEGWTYPNCNDVLAPNVPPPCLDIE